MRLIGNILGRSGRRKGVQGFDARFYLSHYEDLGSLRTPEQAIDHYRSHGRAEGRFPNQQAFLEHAERLIPGIGEAFDAAAYRFNNKDLTHRFASDDALFRHYVHHGHAEGRSFRYPHQPVSAEPVPPAERWTSVFSVAEFLNWCGDQLDPRPDTREAAIATFRERGTDALWPINLEYAFDAGFVRGNGLLPAHGAASDADLYRAWLAEGFPAGVAPNEALFLAPYLGGLPYPASFDWQAFARRATLGTTTRSLALVALFELPAAGVLRHIDLMGADAPRLLDRIGRRALAQGDGEKAAALLARSAALAPDAETLCLLGDAHRERGAPDAAARAYADASVLDDAPARAFLHLTAFHAARHDFAAAFAILRRAPRWRQEEAFGRALHDTLVSYFDHRSASAHALLRDRAVQEGDAEIRRQVNALLTETLTGIRDLLAELDSLPAATGGDPQGYVAMLANDDLPQCTHYRIEQKRLAFERAGIALRVFPHSDVDGFLDSLIGARAAIFYRVAAVPPVVRAILHADAMGLCTYYEVDDLIFDPEVYPDPFASFEEQVSPTQYAGLVFGVPLFRFALSMCQRSIASTPALAREMAALTRTGEGIVLRNGLDDRNAAAIRSIAPVAGAGGRVRIFYGSGTRAHNADFNDLVAPALLEVMKRHAHVDLVIVGHLELRREFAAMGARVMRFAFTPDLDAYWATLAACDINIAVLAPGRVADCKSEIKWLEAAVLRLPSIVSDTRTYREVVEPGVDGVLAGSVAQWRDALEQLVTDAAARTRIGDHARRKALADYALDRGADVVRAEFGAPPASRADRAPRLRVLVCNVFFAPQSHGGATRVVEDNVRAFAAHHPDLEVAVFCSDQGAAPAGRLRLTSENGVPVYRLATPEAPEAEMRPFNDDHVAPFERVLRHFRPDIIHFHCIQRLTASIVEVALARGIPYLVTLHDGWWISDNQFLVDRDGMLRLPGRDVVADGARAQDPVAAIGRRQRLAGLLRSARARLSVSASFAKIYQDAGIGEVTVVENGVSPVAGVQRPLRADGRVALGHIGGRTLHKGAPLVEAVLRTGRYERLHLTMVDGALAPGQAIDTLWGTTPVTLVAPVPPARLAELYGRLDVLLAPSIWPESFGLVAREALGSGLWLVASDLGAMGEDVEEARNGFRIDVSTTNDLRRVLSRIDDDPERYRGTPPEVLTLHRRAEDQAADLCQLYRSLVEQRG